jgi:hypothetical protein
VCFLNTRSKLVLDDPLVFRVESRSVFLLEIKAAAVVFGRAMHAAIHMAALAFRTS